jgi:hypothetical protein
MIYPSFGGGVIGNTAGSGPVVEGSSPSPRAKTIFSLVLVISFLLLSACSHLHITSTTSQSTQSVPSGIVSVNGIGWNQNGLLGPTYQTESCSYRKAADGYSLPDPHCTPGAINTQVTQANISSTICASGWSESVRPPESITEPAKLQAMVAYSTQLPASKVEFDHLIPLELGGTSTTSNLWPEPNEGSPAQFNPKDPYGNNAKDGVEDEIHYAVCRGIVSLAAAQNAIASNWTTAITTLGITP